MLRRAVELYRARRLARESSRKKRIEGRDSCDDAHRVRRVNVVLAEKNRRQPDDLTLHFGETCFVALVVVVCLMRGAVTVNDRRSTRVISSVGVLGRQQERAGHRLRQQDGEERAPGNYKRHRSHCSRFPPTSGSSDNQFRNSSVAWVALL